MGWTTVRFAFIAGGWPTLTVSASHYSLEVVQHPLRARMCGFGDKVRSNLVNLPRSSLRRIGDRWPPPLSPK